MKKNVSKTVTSANGKEKQQENLKRLLVQLNTEMRQKYNFSPTSENANLPIVQELNDVQVEGPFQKLLDLKRTGTIILKFQYIILPPVYPITVNKYSFDYLLRKIIEPYSNRNPDDGVLADEFLLYQTASFDNLETTVKKDDSKKIGPKEDFDMLDRHSRDEEAALPIHSPMNERAGGINTLYRKE